jgi:hypothetical protein
VKITVETEVSNQDLADLVVTAFEGGSQYWCDSCHMLEGQPVLSPWYSDPLFYGSPFKMQVGRKIIDNAALEAGMQLFSTKYPARFAEFKAGDYDAEDADAFWQCVVLGDVVYG